MSLKELTQHNHELAESHPFTKLLASGEISEEIYCDYLYNQLPAYHKLETLCEQHGLLTGVETIQRSRAIIQDLESLRAPDMALQVYSSTVGYLIYLDTLDSTQLLAHLYVRHMGDLFGGQIIKKVVPGTGAMYEFENRQELVRQMRQKLTDDLAREANLCFEQILLVFDSLAHEHNIQ